MSTGHRLYEVERDKKRMAFLLLNFTQKIETGSKWKDDLYVKPLKEQYDILLNKYSGIGRRCPQFESFVQMCCHTQSAKKYFLSTPDILREDANTENDGFYNNIVLRPESDPANIILPQNTDVIFLGNINMRFGEYIVKGFELLDRNVHKYGEMEIFGIAQCAFTVKSILNGKVIPDYGKLEPGSSIFTRDVMHDLRTKYYPVPDHVSALRKYEELKRYIDFRNYYLEQLGKNYEPINDCEVITAYAIKKSQYNKEPDKYKPYLLEGEELKGEEILLDKEIGEAEALPLVRVVIKKSKKELEEQTDKKTGRSLLESRLSRFTKQFIALRKEPPRQGNEEGFDERKDTIPLDERLRFCQKDIAPDYTDLDKQEKNKITTMEIQINEQLETRIDKIINNEKDQKKREQMRKDLRDSDMANIAREKDSKRTNIKQKYNSLRQARKETCTMRCYNIYFSIEKAEFIELKKNIQRLQPKCLVFNNTPERIKIERQEKALNGFFRGYVKNPFLAMYLFSPEKITKSAHTARNGQDIDFFSDRLNDRQKEAVRKALVSDSVFLLQGPPGTGKTEVIAEITAQFALMGKRILISSETHKAIDNVFDRLPKISCIRPLRLIPSHSNRSKDNNYAPENLVDNFYTNIGYGLEKEIERFEHYAEYKDNFKQKLDMLKVEAETLERSCAAIQDMERRIKGIEQELKANNESISRENNNLQDMREQKEELEQAVSNIENLSIRGGDNDAKMEQFKNELGNCLKKFPCIVQSVYAVGAIYHADIAALREEINTMSANPEIVKLEQLHAKTKEKLKSLKDEYTDEILPGKEREHNDLQRKFIELGKRLRAEKQNTHDDFSDSQLSKLIIREKITPELLREIPKQIMELQRGIAVIKEKYYLDVVKKQNDLDERIAKQNDRIRELEKIVRQKRAKIEEDRENCGYEDFQKREASFKMKITNFFKEFNITADFTSTADALSLMKNEWKKLDKEYARQDAANKEKLPMYRKIVKYLRSGVPLEDDRNQYTRDIFNNVNVFGMTSTSNNKFSSKSIETFERYGIADLDIKQQSIDVVIIDEVSKSAIPDLLIPVLYGKTVILVGDHRQLPPVYDLKHLRDDDFFGLDPVIIDKKKNEKFMEMYEDSFFKQLIYRVPEHLRVRLNKQYRCHEDIMRVFNHFYLNKNRKGDLELGMVNQNTQKQHGISVTSLSGLSLIQPDKHIYLVDCSDSYENFAAGSTSATNKDEADVIAKLAREIDFVCGNLAVKPRLDREKKLDERLSMGVICTYGAQVRIIRNMLRNQLKNVNQLPEERFTVSTVDDFQGDERDIIFVSMVRNPPSNKRATTRAEFVKQFERINVAFSRARRLLIIAASRKFFSDIRIDLPDMDGHEKLNNQNYSVYQEIFSTILQYGKVIPARDILGGR